MKFSIPDTINLLAMVVSIAGSFLMFYYTPLVNSQLYIYKRAEMEDIRKRDSKKNKLQRVGMFLLFIGFLLQAIALFLSVASKQ